MKAKRITGIILAICLLFTMIPMAAAEGAGSTGVTEVSDHDELQAVLDAGGTAKLVHDIEGGVTVTREAVIDLNGFVLNGGIDIPRNSGGSLTLKDSDPASTHNSMTYTDPTDGVTVYEVKGGVVTGRISVNAKGQFFMEAGTLTGSSGIFVNNGTVVMSGGTIAGITGGVGEFESEDGTWASGGVVFVSGVKGSFTMEDGLITCNVGRKKYDFENRIYNDVGIGVDQGTFTMKSGSITRNVYANGGGVAIREDGVFNMLGGEISWNQAQNGGGVYVDYGTFNMSGGSIAYNTANSGGGIMTSGWHFAWSSTFIDGVPHLTFPISKYVNITGGSITGNKALDGGGILLICPTHLEISDASVTDNIAETQGGGIRIGRVILTIDGNKEGTYSYPINGTHEIELQNCVISGNTAGENGGGMWVPPLENQEKATVDWPDYSGDVFFPQSIFNVYDNVVISDNTSEGNGGIKPDDLYLAGEALITAAGDMTGTTIGVTSEKAPTREEPILLTKNLSEFGNAKNFFSDDDIYSIGLNDEGEALLGIFFADLTFEVIWYDKDGNMVYPSADVNCMLQVSADKGETWTPVQTILGTNGNTYIVRDNTYDVYDIRVARAGSNYAGDWRIILEDIPTTDSDGNRLIYRLVEDAPMTVGSSVYYCLEYDDITYDPDGAFTARFVIPGQIGYTLHNMGEPKSDDQANAVIVNYEPDPEAYTLAVIKVDFSNQNSRLQGADFKLYDENKALIAKRTSDKDGTADFWGYITPPDDGSGWGSGVGETSGSTRTVTYTQDVKYYLEESRAPEGYLTASEKELVVTWTKVERYGKRSADSPWTLMGVVYSCTAVVDGAYASVDIDSKTISFEVANEKTAVYVSNVDVDNGWEIEGANLQIIDSNNNVVEEWIAGSDAQKIEGLKIGEVYTLHEETAPDGYKITGDDKFTIDAAGEVTFTGSTTVDGSGNTVMLVENELTAVYVSKVDVADGEEVEGAKLQIINSEGNVVDEWSSKKNAYEIRGLKTGEEYTLHEEIAPEGYTVAADTKFSLDAEGKLTSTGSTTVDENGNTVMLVENAKTVIYVSKVDVADGIDVEGAKLQIIDNGGNVVEEWISAGTAHKIEGLKTGEEYTVHEEIAPEGYTVAADTKFTLDADGKVTSTGSTSTDENGDTVLIVENAKTIIRILKADVADGRAVEGAKLQILDNEGNVIDEWTSNSEARVIEGLKTGEEYTIQEKVAPEGYTVTTDTTFTIDVTGKITTTGSLTVDENGNTVMLVENAKTVVYVSKVDIDGGWEVEGATLQIIDSNGNVVEEWISAADAHKIEGLKTGEEY
ncbi:MAG: hypothetical protein J5584_10645, partial [Clostridia bacterium]|nr:hypothetical protein [Clostridia bacterium]